MAGLAMLSHYVSPLALGFTGVRLALVAAALAGLLLLWRRPSPVRCLFLILGLNLAAWTAYVVPLGRLYALDEGSDRAFNVGMAACVAAGHSPLEHTQVHLGSPEPFWNLAVAALAFFRPERAMAVYHWLAPMALIVVGLGLYYGLRTDQTTGDAWERVLIVFAVFAMASLSMNPRPPAPPLWMANFLYKPNHAMAWGLVGIIIGAWARPARRPPLLGLLLGLLAWVFLLTWAYLLAGLVAGTFLRSRREGEGRTLAIVIGVSTLVALPFILHLTTDYNPFGTGRTSRHMWDDPGGLPLAVPYWSTLDLGPLLVLGLGGGWWLGRRGAPRDRVLLGLLAAAWVLWILSIPAALIGVAPEPDELHYFLRFTMALAAGAALAAVAGHLEAWRGLRAGQGHVLVMILCLPMSFFAYWDPPSMDRYYAVSLEPIRPKVLAYGQWVRENTPASAVFLAGRSSSIWIPVLAGRRVLLAAGGKVLPRDYDERKGAERVLLTASDPEVLRRTAARFGVTHLAIDEPLMQEYGTTSYFEIGRSAAYKNVFANSAVRIAEITRPETSAVER